MHKAILVPDLGVAQAVISAWYAHPGERVLAGDRVVELLLGAATFDVPSPCSGRLMQRLAQLDDPVAVGQTVGYIEEDA
jgi:pyruvate/2-oxoglutarate dehydrogenase complex dihydrolipoamide acyltransferase (E2) component